MKLLYCPKCDSMFNLKRNKLSVCECGKSGGKYNTVRNAVFFGEPILVGFANLSFVHAVKSRNTKKFGTEFVAFTIPDVCDTFVRDESIKPS